MTIYTKQTQGTKSKNDSWARRVESTPTRTERYEDGITAATIDVSCIVCYSSGLIKGYRFSNRDDYTIHLIKHEFP